MPRIKVEEGRKLTEINFGTDHYLANMNIKVDPPLPVISKLPTDAIHIELGEYAITVKITIN